MRVGWVALLTLAACGGEAAAPRAADPADPQSAAPSFSAGSVEDMSRVCGPAVLPKPSHPGPCVIRYSFDGGVTRERFFTYDAHGNLLSEVSGSSSLTQSFNDADQITYQHTESPASMCDPTSTWSYDDRHRLVESTFAQCSVPEITDYYYDASDRLVRESKSIDGSRGYEYRFLNDAEGRPLHADIGEPFHPPVESEDWTYDSQGRVLSDVQHFSYYLDTKRYTYSASGTRIDDERRWSEGGSDFITTELCPNGLIHAFSWSEKDDYGSHTEMQITEYDDHGSVVREANETRLYGADGGLVNTSQYDWRTRWTYDADGNVLTRDDNGDHAEYDYSCFSP